MAARRVAIPYMHAATATVIFDIQVDRADVDNAPTTQERRAEVTLAFSRIPGAGPV